MIVTQFLRSAVDYYCNVDEVGVRDGCDDDRRIRLQGTVDEGSVATVGTATVFTISFNGATMPVSYDGQPGGIFKECIPVVVHGVIADGTLEGDRVEVKHSDEYVAVNDERVAVIGSGALGLLTIAALRALNEPGGPLIATAKYPEQRRWAKELGADVVCEPGELERVVRSTTKSHVLDNRQLTAGIDAVVDCVGSEASIAQAVRVCAPGGTVHLVGMPGVTSVDLTPVWQREVALRGTYAYEVPVPGSTDVAGYEAGDDFHTAIDLVRRLDLGRLVSATYPLSRYEDAVAHAATAGARGAVKVAFDLRGRKDTVLASRAHEKKD